MLYNKILHQSFHFTDQENFPREWDGEKKEKSLMKMCFDAKCHREIHQPGGERKSKENLNEFEIDELLLLFCVDNGSLIQLL